MEHNEDDAASSYREYESVDYSESFNEFESPAGLSHDDAVMNDEQGHLKRKACAGQGARAKTSAAPLPERR